MKTEALIQIYPGRERYFERTQAKTRQSKISSLNKRLIARYETYLASTGKTGELTRSDRTQKLRTICEWLLKLSPKQGINADLEALNKKDAETLIAHINTLKSLALDTKATYRKRLKQFYKWFEEEDPRLDEPTQKTEAQKFYKYLKSISADAKIRQANPETIITEEECAKVIQDGCKMPKERAFISLLHETGCRAAEFLNLRIGDLKFRDSILEIHVPDGKTGQRVIYAVKSLPYVHMYLDGHPAKTNRNSPLWVSEGSRRNGEYLVHIGGQKLINRCFERAKVKKKHNWHWFRHSRATILAPKMTEVMLCKYMGWTAGSKQIKRYVHLCNEQLENVFLQIHGLKQQEKGEENPIKCVCGMMNNPKERYCRRCYRPVSVEVAIQDRDETIQVMTRETLKTMEFFMEMAKNPEMLRQFEDFRNRKRT